MLHAKWWQVLRNSEHRGSRCREDEQGLITIQTLLHRVPGRGRRCRSSPVGDNPKQLPTVALAVVTEAEESRKKQLGKNYPVVLPEESPKKTQVFLKSYSELSPCESNASNASLIAPVVCSASSFSLNFKAWVSSFSSFLNSAAWSSSSVSR